MQGVIIVSVLISQSKQKCCSIFTFVLLNFFINIIALDSSVEIITLSPERWQEFRALRLKAVGIYPQAISVTIEDEYKKSPLHYKQLLELAQKEENEWFLFAQLEGKLVGMVGAMCEMKYSSICRHMAMVTSVFVDLAYQNRGIGQILMHALIKKMEESERVLHAMLYVTTLEEAPINLYKKCGFEICGELANAVIIDDTVYNQFLMQRVINKVNKK